MKLPSGNVVHAKKQNELTFPISQLHLSDFSSELFITTHYQQPTMIVESLKRRKVSEKFSIWIFNYDLDNFLVHTMMTNDVGCWWIDDDGGKKELRTRWWWNFKNLFRIVSNKLSSIMVRKLQSFWSWKWHPLLVWFCIFSSSLLCVLCTTVWLIDVLGEQNRRISTFSELFLCIFIFYGIIDYFIFIRETLVN